MAWWQYLILANLYLVLFYGFYALLLRKETFFQLNRVYLVASAMLSFIIPVIQADWVQNLFITRQVKTVIYNGPVILYRFTPVEESVSVGEILAYLYLTGILILAGKLIYQFIRLSNLTAEDEKGVAYSFFKKIKISRELDQNDVIAAHELVHARQWHSVDVLLIEVVSIICWFNPVVYLYRKAIRHIHEFIADSQVVNGGADKADYAMLLLSHTLNAPAHKLVNPFFNNSLLKQRIIMLQKNRSARVKLLKYGLSAPLFAAMLILSSATVNDVHAVQSIKIKTADVLETPITEVRLSSPAPGSNNVPVANKDKNITVELTTSVKSTAPIIDTVPANNSPVFTQVEEQPVFPGGINGFGQYLGRNIRYPAEARNKKIAGRVFLNFIVEKDGSLSDIKVMRGIGGGCDEEAMRVLKNSPKWTPGKQNGKVVRVQYTVPIQFDLATDEPQKTGYNKPAMLDAVTVVSYATREEADVKAATELKGNNDVTVTGYGLKKESTDKFTVVGLGSNDTLKNSGNFVIKFTPNSSANKALVIIDGKESSYDYLSKMNVNTIQSISVLKDNSATSIYGTKGKNGVLLITTKRDK
ncbi:TonB family protein [Mucilaginibacter limnophilus]|uniref:TonB family protein n=1 Tax=Mucilaginibacter limnophilus TaxID=1932778 RepID=A0A437MVP2_9SPHI|nr:M56 family metallopeptidase [Mucilaginibacter limnophilus]RVU01731.1 TonB family protein [Mucilaginibacter limnophilus]